jgi:hypothetical protein
MLRRYGLSISIRARSCDWVGRAWPWAWPRPRGLKLMARVRNESYQTGARDSSQQLKEMIALYRGKTCGARYAEAMRAEYQCPREIL